MISAGSPPISSSGSSRCSDQSRRRVFRARSSSRDDDVHLRVVEQRVLVEIRRPERQPAIVDDRRPWRGRRSDRGASRIGRRSSTRGSARFRRRHGSTRPPGRAIRPRRRWPSRGAPRRRGSRREEDSVASPRGVRRFRPTRETGSRCRRSASPSGWRRRTTRGSRSRPAGRCLSYTFSGIVRTIWTPTSPTGSGA